MADETKPWQVDISKPEQLFYDEESKFKIDKVLVSHEQFGDHLMSPKNRRLIFDRGNAAAGLLYDPERRKVIAVNQFRVATYDPTFKRGKGGGWLIEAVAGVIRPHKEEGRPETPRECLIREVREETGYQLTHTTPIATFFSSPGGSNEIIHLFYAEVRQTAKVAEGGGVKEEGEDIEVVEFDLDEFFGKLSAGEFEDPKLIIAGQWFLARRRSAPAEYDKGRSRTFQFGLKKSQDRIVGIKTGDIKATRGVEVWVNSENTDMMMDRFFGRSVSATIRRLGANKHEGSDTIAEDTIGRALAAKLGDRNFVAPATVIQTPSGQLAKPPHRVKRIFHVASVVGEIEGLSASLDNIEKSIDNVLDDIDAAGFASVLVPLMATGQGGFPVEDVAPKLIERAIAFLQRKPKSPLKEIYFLAYTMGDREILERIMQKSVDLQYLGQN